MTNNAQVPLVLIGMLATVCAGCATRVQTSELADESCELTQLGPVFDNPVAYFGSTFCGNVRLVYESRTIMVFPSERPLPVDRTDVVIVPDASTFATLQEILTPGSEAIAHMEGELRPAMIDCFEGVEPSSDLQTTCTPFRRPMDIEVTQFRILSNQTGDAQR